MPSKKKKEPLAEQQLKKSLAALTYSLNQAKSKLSFHKEQRTYGRMAEFFGLEVKDPDLKHKPVSIKDIDIYYEQLKEILQERFSSRKYLLLENITIQEVASPSQPLEHHLQSTYVSKYPDQKATLLTKEAPQEQDTKILWDNFVEKQHLSQLLVAQTGSGKTYILGSFLKNFIEQGWISKLSCYSPWPILYVTKSVVEQTEKVLADEFGIDTARHVIVVNIEFLRTKLGSKFVSEETVIINGQPEIKFKWKRLMHPCLIVWDECQILARDVSIQSKIAQAYGRIQEDYKVPVFQLFASATPGSRVCEFRCFATGTKTKFPLGAGNAVLCDETWSMFANRISAPSKPEDYCEAAVKRLIDFLEPYIVRVKGIKPKHKGYTNVSKIWFENDKEREEYDEAWEEYQRAKARIEGYEGLTDSQSAFALLAQFTIFAKKAEYIRRYLIAKFIVETWNKGEAPVVACRNKATITAVIRILILDYGWSRDDISVIWGGSTETLSKRKKLAKKIQSNSVVLEKLAELDINLEDLNLDMEIEEKTGEELEFEKRYELLTQNPHNREKERLKFQRQQSKVCLFTFKVGLGLSLHHEAQYLRARQRRVLCGFVWSEREFIQALGRCPRITSMSDTFQTIAYYGGTIEERIAQRVVMKLKCLKGVVKTKEFWEDIITGKVAEEPEEVLEGNALIEYKEAS